MSQITRADDGQELRLALGMRGGVSLAVWIGGACGEIDRLRRMDEVRSGFWYALAKEAGYRGVIVDVLAGASAGGINGVLYAAAQVYGASCDSLRNTWLEVAGTNDLLRTKEPWPSLFDGDERMLAPLHTALAQLAESGKRDDAGAAAGKRIKRADRIDLRLSATLIEPVVRPVPSPADEKLLEQRPSTGFHFRHHSDAWLGSDIAPAEGAELNEDGLWRLALAGRATSSYPGAFEAAKVCSTRPRTFDDSIEAGGEHLVDMADVFGDRSGERRAFNVADGGVLDNIPLGRALDAIAAAPADGPTRRVLLYLQPGVPTPEHVDDAAETTARSDDAAGTDDEQRRATTSVLRGITRARIGSETINGDIAQLEGHNEGVERAVAARRGTFAGISSRRDLSSRASELLASYREQRADDDARLIRDLLMDPIGTLGEDPFPLTVATRDIRDERWRSPLERWSPENRERLWGALHDWFCDRIEEPELAAPTSDTVDNTAHPRQVTAYLGERIGQTLAASLAEELSTEGARQGPLAADVLSGLVDHTIDQLNIDELVRLVTGHAEATAQAAAAAVLQRGTRPLARVTVLLLEWARYLEQCDVATSHQKTVLYRTLAFIEEVLERPRRIGWVAAAALLDGTDLGDQRILTRFAEATRWLDRLCDVPSTPDSSASDGVSAEEIVTALVADAASAAPGDPNPLAVLATARSEALRAIGANDGVVSAFLESLKAPSPVPDPKVGTEDVRTAIADRVLSPIANQLRDASTGRDATSDAPGQLLHRVLSDARIDRGTLGQLEVVCYREFSAGQAGRRPLQLARMSAGNRTPIAHRFKGLREAEDVIGQHWDNRDKDGAQGIHVNVKLAGNELANFSAFLRPEWRANDWLWGRLDAVPTLVDILVDPERLRSRHTKDSAFAAIEHLAVPDGHPLHELLAEEWKGSKDLELGYSRAEKVKAELDTLMGGGDAANTPLVEIRNALIARRQWEILAEELALPTNLEPARSKPSPETVPAERFDVANTKWMTPVPLKDQVKQYAVGAETIRTVDDALPDRFDALIEATAQAIRWNASTEHGGRLPLGGRITPLVLGVLRAVLRLGSTQLLKPASGRQRARTATAVALAVAALAAAVVYGIVTNPTAFILGIAVTLAIVVALGAVAAVWMRPNE